jgi:hypothetical protein
METIQNLVTVDLDESRGRAAPADLEAVADGLLEALDRTKTSATFFVPRQFAESSPRIARRFAECGHEVACLTTHQPATAKPYSPRFLGELHAARDAIEEATGVRVRGHRNAAFAVDYESEWVYDVLVDHGFEYDSSRIPPKYVDSRFEPMPRTIHAVRRWAGTLLEIPMSTADLLSMRVQVGTTGTIRGIPLPVWSALVEGRQARGEPLVMHLRASELRRNARFSRKASATADRKTMERVSRIVGRFPFTSVANALPRLLRSAPIIES